MTWRGARRPHATAVVLWLVAVLCLAGGAPVSIQTSAGDGGGGKELRGLAQLPRLAGPATEDGVAVPGVTRPLLRAQRHRDGSAHTQHLHGASARQWRRRHLSDARPR